ncbi:MAG: hypothetical protein HS129_01680 [Leptospiraceae bacterium]|nr:hypothetical protein [Leptospiraceae bacterium]NUM42085.1 hypothetical protein [Leptospiraceae bacterium]
MHHIAITSPNPKKLSEFYSSLPGISKPKFNFNEKGKIRSVWFEFGKIILMIEKGKKNQSPHALIFTISKKHRKELKKIQPLVFKKTLHTLYLSDPEGNIFGFSSYPNILKLD